MAWIDHYGYLGIGMLIVAENVFPPIPSEVILTFGGFLTTCTRMTIPGVILFSTIGSVLGALILYGAGRMLPEKRLEQLLDGRLGRLLHFQRQDVEKAALWFNRRGILTVLLCRCVPVVRSLISIPAGMAGMEPGLFLFYTTLGSAVWNTLLVGAGAAAGEAWPAIVRLVEQYTRIVVWTGAIFFCMLISVLALYRIHQRRQK